MPDRPPIMNRPMNATAYSIGGSKRIRPIHIVPIQLKILTPVGTPIANDASMNQIWSGRREADREHVVAPHEEAQERDRDDRVDERLVAEERLAREHGDDLGDHPEPGQRHHVDDGVRVEPEQVLVEDRPVRRRLVEARAVVAVHQQHRERPRQHRPGDDDHDGVDVDRPREERHAREPHARRAHVVDRADEVDRPRAATRCRGCAGRRSTGRGRARARAPRAAGSPSSRHRPGRRPRRSSST